MIITDRQMRVLDLRKGGLKQVKVAEALRVSQAAVSQAEKSAMIRFKQAVEEIERFEGNGLLCYARVAEDPIENARIVLSHVCLPYMASGSFAQWLLISYQYFSIEDPIILRVPMADVGRWMGFYGSKVVPMGNTEFEEMFARARRCGGVTIAPLEAVVVDCVMQGRGREASAVVICMRNEIDFDTLRELARRCGVLDPVSYIVHEISDLTKDIDVVVIPKAAVRNFPKPVRKYREYEVAKVVHDNSDYLRRIS